MTRERVPTTELEAAADILIVDDEPKNLVALEAMLAPLGQNVVCAASGKAALRQLLERDFALLLLDIQMPELDGFEVAQSIRNRERSRHMPIIFLTAFDREDAQVSRAYELGAVDFLFKPIVPYILRSKVQAFVDLWRKTREIKRQLLLLREVEQREHERRLADAAQSWEAERLREEMQTEREVAAALSIRNLELASADRRKDEFLAMLAHELRNPMAPIVNAVELLRMPGASPAVVARALDALERQTAHMVRLVDDLLDLSRVTTGKIELRREPVTLSSIVSHAMQTSAPLLAKGEHSLDSSLPEDDIVLFADAARLSQVVANLLNNAAKYSPPRSRILLEARHHGSEVVIRVRDHGVGIRADMLEAVFGLFVQIDPSTDRAQGGLGIGLALVKTLVELHGGSVSASSAGEGEGSEFSVRLPTCDDAPVMAVPSPDALRAHGAHAYRVMVVEDNEDIRESMRDLLEISGYETMVAGDGPSGVEGVLSGQPDIAFIDIGLPGLNGYEVAEALRRRAPGLATRLVALTGYGRTDDRERALVAGFDDHVVKPATAETILGLIQRHCVPREAAALASG
jgi:signal transduction histidine kinase